MLQTDLLWLKKSEKLIYGKIPKTKNHPKKKSLVPFLVCQDSIF
jgi:hypothetical protein